MTCALARRIRTLQSLMQAEERIILGGFSAQGLGTTPTPTLTSATTGGHIAAATVVSVICVALTMDGMVNASLPVGVPATITRQNADGTSTTYNAGAAQRSANATITVGGTATNSVTASVAAVQGAAGYAWFVGTAGAEQLVAITRFSMATFTALGTSGFNSTALTSDLSKNSTVFDGLLSLNTNPSSAAYWYGAVPGQSLTPTGDGGIVEFDEVLRWYYDVLRAEPSKIWVSSQEMQSIRQTILTGASGISSRFVFNTQQGQIVGGGKPKGYINMFGGGNSGGEIPFEVHPYLPPGTVIFTLDTIPYPQNNVNNVMQILSRKDYHQREWPQVTRAYQYGVYSDEVLQHYFPVSIAVISNLAPTATP